MSGHESADASETPATEVDLLAEVTQAISQLESHGDPAVRDAARTLLAGIDTVHRVGLTHLVQGIQGLAGEAFLNRLLADPAVRLLLMSYNLVAVDRRLQAEEAVDAVRGHLHDHGVDVEIAEVVGGVVYVRLHASHRADASRPVPDVDRIRRDLESALQDGLLGFQELIIGDRNAAVSATTIPMAALRRAHRPVYFDAGPADLDPGAIRAVDINDISLLLAAVDGEIHAVENRCGDSPLPLHFSALDGTSLRCSWHGCLYDVRTGQRTDRGQERLRVFPVSIENGRVRVALDVAPAVQDR